MPLSKDLEEVYDVGQDKLTPQALAYLRAREADPKCSYGDFAALSEVVDEQTASFMKREVSDGVIAPGYDPKALEILKTKKGGAFLILEIDPDYVGTSVRGRARNLVLPSCVCCFRLLFFFFVGVFFFCIFPFFIYFFFSLALSLALIF